MSTDDGDDSRQGEQEVRALNERYYSRSPALYFRQRLNNLTVCAARLPDYRDALLAGIGVGDLTIKVDEHEAVDSDLDEEAARAEVARCLHLSDVERSAWTDEQFETAVDNLMRFLCGLAERLEDDKELYNAAKHGLTMFASTAHLQFQDEDGKVLFAHGGPSLEYLHSTPWSGDRVRERQWTDVTVWLNVVGWWALTYVATEIMNTVWTVGRRTFIGPQEGDQIWLPVDMTLQDVYTAHGGSPLQRFRRPILREHQDRR